MNTLDSDVKPYVTFVTTHPGSAKHFAILAEELMKRKVPFGILSGVNVVKVFKDRSLSHQEFDDKMEVEGLAQLVLKVSGKAKYVITDISDAKWQEVHKALAISAPDVCRAVYYDNPEKFVPGGYSETAAKVIPFANLVLFASARLENEPIFSKPGVEINLEEKKRIGLGLYPTEEADTIQMLKLTEAKHLRKQLFDQLGIQDEGQKVISYLGGANEVYYEKAFPRFLEFVSRLSKEDVSLFKSLIFLLQQHPRAAKEGNRDVNQITEGIVLSKFTTNQVLAISALAIYYQTSMAAQLPMANLPALQVGHETFPDSLTENGFPSATDYENFKKEIGKLFEEGSESDPIRLEKVKSSVGMREDWRERWFHFLH